MSSDRRMTEADAVLAIMNGVRRIETLEAQLAERDAQLKYQADLASQHRDELEAQIAALTAAGDAMAKCCDDDLAEWVACRQAWTKAKGESQC